MKDIFDKEYKDQFLAKGLLDKCGGDLQHLISDAATMQLIRWTDGGFGMAAHNYDGDMCKWSPRKKQLSCVAFQLSLLTSLSTFPFGITVTDQIAQVHRSPGFITSNLVGRSDDGRLIKEFEASHGTVSDLWKDHLAGKETSLNPLGLVEAMIGAMQHAAVLDAEKSSDPSMAVVKDQVFNYTTTLRTAMHNTFRYGQGTRDMSGPSGFTTEDFVRKVAWRLQRYLAMQYDESPPPKLNEPSRKFRRNYNVDEEAVNQMFQKYDKNNDGYVDYEEFTNMMIHMNLAPLKKGDAKQPDV
jgi:isocitrate dehydrogenase